MNILQEINELLLLLSSTSNDQNNINSSVIKFCKLYQCPVCMTDIMENPVMLGSCQHMTCLKCALELIDSTIRVKIDKTNSSSFDVSHNHTYFRDSLSFKCPLCRAECAYKNNNDRHRVVFDPLPRNVVELYALCFPNSISLRCCHHGCSYVASNYENIIQHIQECRLRSFHCPKCSNLYWMGECVYWHPSEAASEYHIRYQCSKLYCYHCWTVGDFSETSACMEKHKLVSDFKQLFAELKSKLTDGKGFKPSDQLKSKLRVIHSNIQSLENDTGNRTFPREISDGLSIPYIDDVDMSMFENTMNNAVGDFISHSNLSPFQPLFGRFVDTNLTEQLTNYFPVHLEFGQSGQLYQLPSLTIDTSRSHTYNR